MSLIPARAKEAAAGSLPPRLQTTCNDLRVGIVHQDEQLSPLCYL